MSKEPDKWHRRGIIMTFVAVAIVIAVGVAELSGSNKKWHAVTRYSDTPSQVITGIEGLEREIVELKSEIDFRVKELRDAEARATRKSMECAMGQAEPGETVDAEKLEQLKALSPEWGKAATAASEALRRTAAN